MVDGETHVAALVWLLRSKLGMACDLYCVVFTMWPFLCGLFCVAFADF